MNFTTAEQPAIIRRIFRDSNSRVQFIDSNGDVVHVASYQAEIQITSLELGRIAVAPLYFVFQPFYFSVEDLTEIDVDGTATNYGASGSPAYTEPTLDFEEVKAKVRDVYEQLATEVFYECCSGSGGGNSTVTNNYSSLADPQKFNPDASGVSANTANFTLATTYSVAFVTINGQVIRDIEYSLLNDVLTVTPDNGFNAITDEVLVWQHTFNTGFANQIKTGFIDYNDNTGSIPLVSGAWTDIPNNGLGPNTNKQYRPTGVSEVMDVSTGYLDFSDLTLGSELAIRNDFSVTPNTNNALLQVRYLLGQGAGQYPLVFWSERLDNGSGIPYQRVPVFSIYMGDLNTKGGVGKLQVKLSTNGTIENAGSYVSIQLR